MEDKFVETYRPEETFELGRRIGQEAAAGSVFTLIGDLGTGKTVFTQGLAKGLGITEPVNSPTFTILQCLIEWADLIEEILPEHFTEIIISKDLEKGFDYRKIRIKERYLR